MARGAVPAPWYSRFAFPKSCHDSRVLPPVSAPAPELPTDAAPARRSRAFVAGIIVYLVLVVSAFVTANPLLDEFAAFTLISVVLLPGLRRGRAVAWLIWVSTAIVLVWLARRGHGQLALDSLPILINIALCRVFARTLAPGHEPLIAHIIGVLEGPERLALPRVSSYARELTRAWALLFAVQACVLSVVVACSVPDGLLASLDIAPPFAIAPVWRWYLHLGSYLLVLGFLVAEYAFRRWHLRHIPHAPLPVFIARLGRRWPAMVAGFVADASRSHP
jgi:uncharacterized membrane protein